MALFQDIAPSIESYWRAIVLFGRNSASYKFAFAKSLLGISSQQKTFVTLEELAAPFALEVCDHLKYADRQGHQATGSFLDTCRAYNAGTADLDRLRRVTTAGGFQNVIDAFHNLQGGETPVRFFVDDRKSKSGITVTDELLQLKESPQFANLTPEAESRWRLVETAWELRLSRSTLLVRVDLESKMIFSTSLSLKRPTITSCRDALDGYQKGKCFYCFQDVSIESGHLKLADVDHFFPRQLFSECAQLTNLDGIWNLVLACKQCNRGSGGKSGQLPALDLLKRLHTRNTFLIESHHPLRETLLTQTGQSEAERINFLQSIDSFARERLVHRWSPIEEAEPVF